MIKESELRNMIKNDVTKLKGGLILLDENEKRLLNKFGASGKIDLYAKDERNRHVIIELKRSDTPARQALHEVSKYVELLKRNLGVKDTEIHVIIASTTWHELLLPFSRFVNDVSFSIEGLYIEMNQDNTSFSVKNVECTPICDGRLISPWHNMLWFSDKRALDVGIVAIRDSYSKKYIEDYIAVVLRTDDLEKYYHEYVVYVALRSLSKEECIAILSEDKELLEQVLEDIENMDNNSHLILKKDIARCLEDNVVWKNHIMRIVDEIHKNFPNSEIDVSIFNPGIGALTVYFARTKEKYPLYLPDYSITVKKSEVVRVYFGALKENENGISFQELLKKYYNNDITQLLLSMTWGGKDPRDVGILEDMGLSYRSFYVDIDRHSKEFYALKEDRWRHCPPINPLVLFQEYLYKNLDLVHQLVKKMRLHCYDEDIMRNSSTTKLDDIVNFERNRVKNSYYTGTPKECDICKSSFDGEKYMIDGAMGENLPWANMCADCFEILDVNIGWGQGQLYAQNPHGWLLVAGGSDCNDSE